MRSEVARRIAEARRQEPSAPEPCPTEPHYTPEEIAEILKLSRDTVVRRFRDVPGVFKLPSDNERTKGYTTLRIPASVFQRFYRERVK